MPKYILALIFVNIFFFSCEEVINNSQTSFQVDGEWLIPKDKIFDGGPGKDGIPALVNPVFIPLSETSYLEDDDLVLIYKKGSEIRAYPHPILDWHEIINDDINNTKLTVSYCPLTGSGIGLSSKVTSNGISQNTTFGVSGLLYNSNLILYDRLSNSNWSQMRNQCVNGDLIGQESQFIHMVETTVLTLRQMYPNAMIVSNNTGVYSPDRYSRYPYGDYRTSNSLIFPVSPNDSRLPRKERVLGIIGNSQNRIYQFKHFTSGIQVKNDSLGNVPIVVVGSKDSNFLVGFKRDVIAGQPITFTAVQNNLPIIMKDANNNFYNVFGDVVNGPRMGTKLSVLKSFIGYWFAWGAFYPEIEIGN